MELIQGKRYEWYINNYEDKKKNGLFTGEYDKSNGNAILLTRNGERWSVPVEDLYNQSKICLGGRDYECQIRRYGLGY